MRTNLVSAAAAMVLAACMSTVFAAASMNLTDQQKQSIQHGLANQPTQPQPSGFTAQLGKKIPSSVTLGKVPSHVAQNVPSVKNDEFAKFDNNEIVIVNPTNKEIMAIVGQSSTTGAKAGSTMQGGTADVTMPKSAK